MTYNKTSYIIIAIVVLVIIAGAAWWFMQTQNSSLSGDYSNTQGSNTSTNTSANLSYVNALKLYGDDRIQFDQNCLLVPNEVTFKTGTTIMLDNRANKSRVVALDNVNYTIGAYDYAVVTLKTNAALPHTISVDCGKGENQGRILLQK